MMVHAADSQNFWILVAIETDATRYHGTGARRPLLLSAADAEQLLAHLAADLQSLLPGISECGLIAVGALFDQTEILRPAYPVFTGLESAARGAAAGSARRGLISIAARDGRMPVEDLQPSNDIPLGALQILPVVVQGPRPAMAGLTESMEYRFLEEGQLSAHSVNWLQSAFDVVIHHARLMTLTDLIALLRLQLEHYGFLALWELLDAALSNPDGTLGVTTAGGQSWEWRGRVARTAFETFDYWAASGGGAALAADRLRLAAGYADWTRELRQYLTTLAAHRVDVELHLPGKAGALQGSFYQEISEDRADSDACVVTQHQFDDLGTIAITLVQDGRIENIYPLRPRGLNDVHVYLRDRIPEGHTVAFPGTILYDETTRRLRPDASC